jgi:DNA polymerase
MNVITFDAETYFDADYSLKKMSCESYVRDNRFEVHGAAIRWENGQTIWYDAGPSLGDQLHKVDWANTAVLCHHAQFDGLILSHRYGIRPKLWLDTLSMARAVLDSGISLSLDSLAKHFNLGAKSVPYDLFKGKHWDELDGVTQLMIAQGCMHDVNLTWQLFNRLNAGFPPSELLLIDRTIRMFTEPVLEGDGKLLVDIWEAEAKRKAAQNGGLGVTTSQLRSAAKFQALLEAEGVEVATKPGKKGDIPAFAYNDDFMRELLDHESARVRALAEARLGTKSSMVQDRASALGWMATRGPLCVYLKYFGAHTSRWSGGDGSNFQNLKRGHALRHAIRAPQGKKLAIIDLGQIECRILNWLAGEQEVVERFRAGADPYVSLASLFYGRAITRADAAERGTGKQGELSCGYGCGWRKFQKVAALGTYGPAVELSDDDAQRAVNLYRQTHPAVVQYWRDCELMLQRLSDPRYEPAAWGPMTVGNRMIKLPNGLNLRYDTLERYEGEWRLKTRLGWQKQYGAKLAQNVCEGLARTIFSDAILRLPALKLVMMSHDEAVFLLHDDADSVDYILDEFRRPPAWAPDLPLDAEGHLDTVYSK